MKYEYLITGQIAHEQAAAQLNELGAHRWELVAVRENQGSPVLYLKRLIAEQLQSVIRYNDGTVFECHDFSIHRREPDGALIAMTHKATTPKLEKRMHDKMEELSKNK